MNPKPERQDTLQVAMFRALASSTEDYVSCLDRERRVLYLNRLRSRTAAQVLGRRTEEFVVEGQRQQLVAAVEATFESKQPQQLECQVVMASGELRWLAMRVVPFTGPSGEPLVLQISADVTERHELNDELSRREGFQRLIVENLPDFVALVDRERRFLWVNRWAPGLSMERVIGARMDEFLAPESLKDVTSAIEGVFATGEPRQFEVLGYGDGDQQDWYSSRVLPVAEANGAHLLLITTNISNRRRAELALRASEERFRSLAEHSPDYIAVINRQRVVEYLNRAPAELAAHRVVGRSLDELTRPDQVAAAAAAIESVFETGKPAEYEGFALEGELIYRVRVAPFGDGGGRESALVVSTDITQLRKDERSRESLQAQLHQAQRRESIGMLAGGIAHDFNNLLQVIQTNLHFAHEMVAGEGLATDELKEAMRATDRAAELTKHLLAIGRRQRVDPQCVDLSALIERSLRMLRRVIPENIELVFEPALTACKVSGDPPQLEQVLLNLCLNARDAMPSGGKLRVAVGISTAFPARAQLCVSDTGSGISKEHLKRAFEPFFTTKGAGSGLGLAVVAGIVAAHGGTVTVDSEVAQGTTFTVELPLVHSPESEPPLELKPARRGNEVILVAEDEPLVRSQVVRILSRAGYLVLEAANGTQAIAEFARRSNEIDLVLLDVIMPGLDGWQVYERVEALRPGIKVLFTTGYAANALPEDFGSRGKRLLTKPYKPQALLDLVRDVLDAP